METAAVEVQELLPAGDASVSVAEAPGALRPIARRPPRRGSRAHAAVATVVDAVCLAFAWAIATTLLGSPTGAELAPGGDAMVAVLLVLTGLLALRLARLYHLDVVVDSLTQNTAVLKAGGLHLVICLVGGDVLGVDLRPGWLATASLFSALLLCTTRAVRRRTTVARCADGALLRRVLLVGTDGDASAFRQTVIDHPETGLCVVAVAGPGAPPTELGIGVPWVGRGVDDVVAAIDTLQIDAVFVVPSALDRDQLTRLRRVLAQEHVSVHLVNSSESVAGSRLRQTRVGLSYLSHLEVEPDCPYGKAAKRALDIGVGAVITLLALPVMGLVALAILLLDGRPIFFRQTRIGRDLHPFRLLKFRTMVPDAESRVVELESRNERQGPLFKLADDPRVTRSGKLLRATSLDELPQLFNVLLGHMSLVGPRPAMPAEVVRFGEELRSRHRMRPGVTGLWQVRSRDEESFDSYQQLDLFYVENWSLAMDLSILLCTGPAVVGRAFSELRRARPGRSFLLLAGDRSLPALDSKSA